MQGAKNKSEYKIDIGPTFVVLQEYSRDLDNKYFIYIHTLQLQWSQTLQHTNRSLD
jgi:hypothetical protein